MDKEQVYDEQINPLMAQIIEICNAHKIAHACSFHLGAKLFCTSMNLESDREPPLEFRMVVRHMVSALRVGAGV